MSVGIGGDYGGTITNLSGETTERMHKRDNFLNFGWDFVEIWNIGENQTYPYLRRHMAGDLNCDGMVDIVDFSILAGNWLEGER